MFPPGVRATIGGHGEGGQSMGNRAITALTCVLTLVLLAPTSHVEAKPCAFRLTPVADATPQPPDGFVHTGSTYRGLEAVTADDVWAVGGMAVSQWETDPDTGEQVLRAKGSFPLAEHWDGTAWQVTEVPAATTGWL